MEKTKKLLAGLVMLCIVLTAVITMPENALAADSDFVVEDGVLTKYTGGGGDVVIPDGVTTIYGAFTGCTGVKRITIPQSISNIDRAAFWGCTSLQEIKVDAKNSSFSSENGVLYNKNKTKLITYPEGKSGNFVIPDNVTRIANNAFHNCTDLTSIVISQSVSDIEYCAFGGCTNLTDVVISNNVINIDYGVFDTTPWLKKMEQENPSQPLIVNNILLKGKIENGIFMIPTGVTSICADAFDGDSTERRNVTEITIPSSVLCVGECVFAGCENLQELAILNPRTKLGHDVSSILDFGDGWTEFNNSVVTVKGYKGSSAEELVNYMNSPYRSTTFKFVPLDGTGGNDTPAQSQTYKLLQKAKATRSLTISKGKSKTIKVTLPKGLNKVSKFSGKDKTGQVKITYKTSNKKVAAVNSKGKVTAKGKGTAKITISLSVYDGDDISVRKLTTKVKVK